MGHLRPGLWRHDRANLCQGGASGGLQNLVVVLIYIPQSQDHRITAPLRLPTA
jgi:hypothetical protein